jgi:hypothetical protein
MKYLKPTPQNVLFICPANWVYGTGDTTRSSSDGSGSDEDLNLTIHISEDALQEASADGSTESDLTKRLNINNYVIDLSWDVESVDPEEIDALVHEMGKKIETQMGLLLGSLKLRVGVFDGKNYYHAEVALVHRK